MKRVIYFIILSMSFTFVFSQAKPCCKNKAGKGKVVCKYNQANIDVNNNGTITEDGLQVASIGGIQYSHAAQNNSVDKKNCDKFERIPWWKFWVKKKNCCNTKS